jgi:hypothetical protein
MANPWPSSRIIGPLPTSLGEHVKLLAYLYWMGHGRPDGCAHVHWQMALDEVTCLVAYRIWQAVGSPDGWHDQHWARAAWEVQVAMRADEIWDRTSVERRSRLSAWIAAERQLSRGG